MALSPGGRAAINVTPMIDILLVLLITFMIVVNSASVGFEAQVPHPPKDAAGENPQDIVVFVNADNSLTLNQEPVSGDADLKARLEAIFRTRGNHMLFVGAEPEVEFQPIIRVIDIAHEAGLSRVALLPRAAQP